MRILSSCVLLLVVLGPSCCSGFLHQHHFSYRLTVNVNAPLLVSVHTELPAAPTNETSSPLSPLLLIPTRQQHQQQRQYQQHQQQHQQQQQQQQQRIIFGTASLAKAANPFELLDAAYAQGFHRFDLARTYGGDGVSERIFGAWMSQRQQQQSPPNTHDLRSSLQIITKGGMGRDKYGDPHRPVLTTTSLRAEIDASLQALGGTDYVDLYLFHRDDWRLPVAQFCAWAQDELLLPGKARGWGVSNWSFARFREAHAYCLRHGMAPPQANSPQFSLAVPQCEVWPTTQSISGPEYLPQIEWYRENGVELLCWEVLAKGFMAKPHLWSRPTMTTTSTTSAVLDDGSDDDDEAASTAASTSTTTSTSTTPPVGSDAWRLHRLQRAYCTAANYQRRQVAVQVAAACGYRLSQVATLYILSHGVSVIFGSHNLRHLEEMVGFLRNGNDSDSGDSGGGDSDTENEQQQQQYPLFNEEVLWRLRSGDVRAVEAAASWQRQGFVRNGSSSSSSSSSRNGGGGVVDLEPWGDDPKESI